MTYIQIIKSLFKIETTHMKNSGYEWNFATILHMIPPNIPIIPLNKLMFELLMIASKDAETAVTHFQIR